MPHAPILVAVPADVRDFERYRWHASPDTYLNALTRVAAATPIIVPAIAEEIDIDLILDRVDGVLTTGSASNVHPALYGSEPDPTFEPYDTARDALTQRLIQASVARGIPLICICRGHQELNVAFGGTLATEIQEIAGRMDHRAITHDDQRERYATRHEVALSGDGPLAAIVGQSSIRVNSLHRQAIDRLGNGLAVEARAPDGTIEAVSVKGAQSFALGLQWHPEYWAESDAPSAAIFRAFGDACRRYRQSRG
ncbi:gamma-glutamyl-gamma-aminobutyrate hydrolase family protein [Jiella sp. MQZ9-1]|uniref:gamma-glutamyl-gamma-aminobutyrate hydrolase n=1 Tax=Jiella flava TaxID=2816857 RepID=A0A939FY72_9HYPH|nr:gamma-glutamyl-gamma-aminobutyrate hydrolase family protein [Jiella flava]MBO0663054.1 gamma-glutamyl-gamma-aminobutyrate hydrolase family protein [Jiella flava]MCD2471473.1 gamma-glutamyl-gamma-aminobutyrate hydrolase family protein [Jiella flava]